jgi:DNA-binding MarR family transcriptional regulator/GNAT superfamily N-acetyltransferase
MTELIASLGELACASRLKRLADRLMQDVSLVYRERGLAFEPRWFLLFYELGRSGPLPVTELAARIGVTHPAVNQAAAELARHGLLRAAVDRGDRRRRLLELTPQGRQLLAGLQPVWQEVRAATAELLRQDGPGLLAQVERIEASLDRRSMYQRVGDRTKAGGQAAVDIVGYRPAYQKAFKSLNLEWLQAGFTVEPADQKILDHPDREIVAKGGAVLFARSGGKIVGTCGIVPAGPKTFELVKMAVAPTHRGRRIGRQLALAAIAEARQRGGRVLVARTSPLLAAANKLYQSLGFEHAGSDRSGDYRRPTIVLKLSLK